VRVVFLGSPPFAAPTLRSLLGSRHHPVAVVTPPDKPRGRGKKGQGKRVEESDVARLAREAEVRLLRPDSARDPAFLAELRALEPDVCLVASYGELLDEEFLSIPRLGSLNVHGSLLPRHRGASPVQAAILAGDEETGVSIQRVVMALDAGDVLLERRTPIGPEETAGELFARLAELGAEAALEALDRLADGTARFTPQDPELVTVCKKIVKAAGAIDWSRDATSLARLVRAMNPWPGARTTAPGGKPLVVQRAAEVSGAGAPGELIEAGERCVVACGSGALELSLVQPAGKRAMTAAEWLRGARLESGDRLGVAEEER
jgi:methionyl-tRNA formyltransferase